MKVIFSTCRNPYFATITEYVENAIKITGCQTMFFNDDDFIIPGRIRSKVAFLNNFDLKRLNNNLLSAVRSFNPDLLLQAGGHRVFPETIDQIKKLQIKTALWTIDPPMDFKPVIKAAPHYDFVFTGGSEAYDILKETVAENLYFLPFACDPDYHKPLALTENEKKLYGSDISFVGTLDPAIYPHRVNILEEISDFSLAVWGSGSSNISQSSPVKRHVRGEHTPPDLWTKIYSASKIVLCMHYKDPNGKIPCHQASPRVYEALACGAFLMVDAQKDVMSLFRDREELVIFRSIDELRELAAYYLERPDERRKIAQAGRKSVLDKHTYRHRIEELLRIVNQ